MMMWSSPSLSSVSSSSPSSSSSKKRYHKRLELLKPILTIAGLYIFASSFFLAKRNLDRTSTCQDSILKDVLDIDPLSSSSSSSSSSCWMRPSVDKLLVLVIDALRFDFAKYRLPKSVGSRFFSSDNNRKHPRNPLLKFVADPPTVTMQRLKGLTTGSLPTFADISGNFGGAQVEEDAWIDWVSPRAFVGDDTWVDLFPNETWKEAYPYPSFNTRDLNTVDDGCLEHLPDLLSKLLYGDLRLLVAHFLGVDHVGHTYGPHTEFMTRKLDQMDDMLNETLNEIEQLSDPDQCFMTLIFGDHGMTEDGNHGGGSDEETGAALMVHYSKGCVRDTSDNTIEEINQIDLVPTISLALGVPIPYANLGGVVTQLMPGLTAEEQTKALLLNVAQVWRYLTDYSQNANRLPLRDLKVALDDAVESHKQGKSDTNIKLKHFLEKAIELGKSVWTRFDTPGMIMGGVFVGLMLLWSSPSLMDLVSTFQLEDGLTVLLATFSCCLLTFSNSYVESEQKIVMFATATISVALASKLDKNVWISLTIPLASRIHELFISGHGLDPALNVHFAHYSFVFLTSLAVLGTLQFRLHSDKSHHLFDSLTLLFIGHSWWEKRLPDTSRDGYISCRIALVVWFVGFLWCVNQIFIQRKGGPRMMAIKIGMGVMIVTGPSTASTMVFFLIQAWAMCQISPSAPTLAFLYRTVVRHAFFATNHGCAFQRLQYSAAFIATQEFVYATGGISLFLNTFGWEFLGMLLVTASGKDKVWKWYCFYQMLETMSNCISVGILRRHLMVWAIFAPRFLFSAIFLILSSGGRILRTALSE